MFIIKRGGKFCTISEYNSERVFKIGRPYLPSYRKNKSGTFYMAHGVDVDVDLCPVKSSGIFQIKMQ